MVMNQSTMRQLSKFWTNRKVQWTGDSMRLPRKRVSDESRSTMLPGDNTRSTSEANTNWVPPMEEYLWTSLNSISSCQQTQTDWTLTPYCAISHQPYYRPLLCSLTWRWDFRDFHEPTSELWTPRPPGLIGRCLRAWRWLGFRGRAEMHRGDAHGLCAGGHRQEYEQWNCMFRDFQRLNPQRGLETPDWWMVVWWCGGKCTCRFHVEHADDATLPATWWEGSLDWEPEDPAVDVLWSHKKFPLVGVFFLIVHLPGLLPTCPEHSSCCKSFYLWGQEAKLIFQAPLKASFQGC